MSDVPNVNKYPDDGRQPIPAAAETGTGQGGVAESKGRFASSLRGAARADALPTGINNKTAPDGRFVSTRPTDLGVVGGQEESVDGVDHAVKGNGSGVVGKDGRFNYG